MSLLVFTAVGLGVLSRAFGWSPLSPQGFHPKRPIEPGDVAHPFDADRSWSTAGSIRLGRVGSYGALHADAACVLLTTRYWGSVAIDRRDVTGVREIGALNRFVHFDSPEGRFDAVLFRVRRNGTVLDALATLGWPVAGRALPPVPVPASSWAGPASGALPPPPPPPPLPPRFTSRTGAGVAAPRIPQLDRVEPTVRKVVSGLTYVVLSAVLVVLALTYAHPPPSSSLLTSATSLLSIATVVLAGVTLLFQAVRQLGDSLRPADDLATRVPFSRTRQRKARTIGLLVFLFAGAIVVTTAMSRHGRPSTHGDRYYLTHNSVTHEVGAGTYRRAVAAQQRPVLAADLFFCTLALLAWSSFGDATHGSDERGLPA